MTTEKAIHRLEELCLHDQDLCDCKNAVDCADCHIRAAIDALEKQIPKKVYVYYDGYSEVYPVWEEHCPECGFDFDGDRTKFCPQCGQAIDWGDKDE